MVADGVHMLLAVALVMVLLRTDRVEPYLVALLAAGLPDLDRYLFIPFLYAGYLSGPLWTHRGITHSLLALAVVVGIAHVAGYWRAAAIGYGSHLLADYLTGEIRLLAPFSTRLYGLYYDWVLGNVVAGAVAVVVVLAGLGAMIYADRSAPETGFGGRVGRWFR